MGSSSSRCDVREAEMKSSVVVFVFGVAVGRWDGRAGGARLAPLSTSSIEKIERSGINTIPSYTEHCRWRMSRASFGEDILLETRRLQVFWIFRNQLSVMADGRNQMFQTQSRSFFISNSNLNQAMAVDSSYSLWMMPSMNMVDEGRVGEGVCSCQILRYLCVKCLSFRMSKCTTSSRPI